MICTIHYYARESGSLALDPSEIYKISDSREPYVEEIELFVLYSKLAQETVSKRTSTSSSQTALTRRGVKT